LEFQMWGENAAGFYDFALVFCNTPVDVLSEYFDLNYGGGTPVKAYQAPYEYIETTMDAWIGFDLDPAFQYDGENNLLVEALWSADEDHTVYNWAWETDGDTYVCGAIDSPNGAIYNLGLRMKLVGEYGGPMAVEPASLGRVKAGWR
jgi:hypothetical protein